MPSGLRSPILLLVASALNFRSTSGISLSVPRAKVDDNLLAASSSSSNSNSLGDESALEAPSLQSRSPKGRLMRHEASVSALETDVAGEPESSAHAAACSPIMKVSKDWNQGPAHVLRTGVYRMTHETQSDGTPLYKNDHGMYLYYWNITKEWRIGWDHNRPDAGVSSPPSESLCPDLAPEWWAFVNNTWTTEHGFEVIADKCAPTVEVVGAETTLPQLMGQYRMGLNCSICPADMGDSCPCRPVYVNNRVMSHGTFTYYLYFWYEFGEWRIGTDINVSAAALTSLEGENKACPAEASSWEKYVDFAWTEDPAIKVQRKSALGSMYDDFVVGSSNTVSCPKYSVRMNLTRCETVAQDLEREYGGEVEDEDKPAGCYQAHGVNSKIFFNTASDGSPNIDAYVVCERTEEYWQHAMGNLFTTTTLADAATEAASTTAEAADTYDVSEETYYSEHGAQTTEAPYAEVDESKARNLHPHSAHSEESTVSASANLTTEEEEEEEEEEEAEKSSNHTHTNHTHSGHSGDLKKGIAIGAGSVLVLALIVGGYLWWRAKKAKEAEEAAEKAKLAESDGVPAEGAEASGGAAVPAK